MSTATIVVHLSADLAERAEALERKHPGVLARAIEYACMRGGIYRHLRENGVLHEHRAHELAVLAENGAAPEASYVIATDGSVEHPTAEDLRAVEANHARLNSYLEGPSDVPTGRKALAGYSPPLVFAEAVADLAITYGTARAEEAASASPERIAGSTKALIALLDVLFPKQAAWRARYESGPGLNEGSHPTAETPGLSETTDAPKMADAGAGVEDDVERARRLSP